MIEVKCKFDPVIPKNVESFTFGTSCSLCPDKKCENGLCHELKELSSKTKKGEKRNVKFEILSNLGYFLNQ